MIIDRTFWTVLTPDHQFVLRSGWSVTHRQGNRDNWWVPIRQAHFRLMGEKNAAVIYAGQSAASDAARIVGGIIARRSETALLEFMPIDVVPVVAPQLGGPACG